LKDCADVGVFHQQHMLCCLAVGNAKTITLKAGVFRQQQVLLYFLLSKTFGKFQNFPNVKLDFSLHPASGIPLKMTKGKSKNSGV